MQTNYRNLLLTVGLGFLLYSCGSQKVNSSENWNQFFEYSNMKEQESKIIKDQENYDAFISKAFENKDAEPLLPKVDFNTQNIIWIAFGEKNTGGYVYHYEGYSDNNNVVEIFISQPNRDPMSPVTMAFTQPLMIVAIPATKAREVRYTIKTK